MKEGWKYCKLGDILDVKHGKDQKEVASPDGKYPIYGSGGTIMGYANAYLCEEGTTILGRKGTIDKPMFMNCKFWNIDTAFGLVPKDGNNPKLIYYICKTIDWKSLDSGAAKPSLTQSIIKNQVALVPPLSEQQSIVTYLDTSFSLIDSLAENAKKALENAKALFQAELKKLMEKKEGWEEKKLGEIAQIKGGKRVPKGYKLQCEPTEHKYIRVADFLDNGTINESNIQYISEDIYEQIKNYTITSKDVYISIAGTIGKSGIIPNTLDGSNLTENACKLVLNEGINNRYIYYGTISPSFVMQMIAATKKSAQPKLALTRLAEIKISIPPLSEQQKIVQTLDTLSQYISQLEQNYNKTLDNCQALKQALLRETFE